MNKTVLMIVTVSVLVLVLLGLGKVSTNKTMQPQTENAVLEDIDETGADSFDQISLDDTTDDPDLSLEFR